MPVVVYSVCVEPLHVMVEHIVPSVATQGLRRRHCARLVVSASAQGPHRASLCATSGVATGVAVHDRRSPSSCHSPLPDARPHPTCTRCSRIFSALCRGPGATSASLRMLRHLGEFESGRALLRRSGTARSRRLRSGSTRAARGAAPPTRSCRASCLGAVVPCTALCQPPGGHAQIARASGDPASPLVGCGAAPRLRAQCQ